jgi:hypothetical protein
MHGNTRLLQADMGPIDTSACRDALQDGLVPIKHPSIISSSPLSTSYTTRNDDVTFDTQTRGVIELEDSIAPLFNLQSYSDFDLNQNNRVGGQDLLVLHRVPSSMPKPRSGWYLFAATQTSAERDIPGRVGSHLP